MSEALNVLVVEDEPTMSELLKKMLMQLGCEKVWVCASDKCALKSARDKDIDLIFMDLNIKGLMDGIQCAKEITLHKEILIVFATSYSDSSILEEAIDVNTLNYLVKPYGRKDIEVTLNLAKAARKKQRKEPTNSSPPVIWLGDRYRLNTISRALTKDDVEITLSKKEFELVVLLARHIDETVKTEQIIMQVWQERAIAASTLRETMTRIRKKLPDMQIKAIHGIGYRLSLG